MMLRGIIVASLAFLVAGAAWATPPRMTTSDDRMVAATQTHFYVLRDIEDNLGSHYAGLLDQHLVEISLSSGEATRFWPLRRMEINRLPQDTFLNPGEVQDRPGETHDLMDVLRDVGAQPTTPHAWGAEDIALQDGALTFKGDTVMTPFAIRAAGRAQLAILREAYPPFETEADYMAGERLDFYDLYAEGDWICELRPETRTLFRATDKLIITKLYCEDAELYGYWSFHVILQDDL